MDANMNAQVGLTSPGIIGMMYVTLTYTKHLPYLTEEVARMGPIGVAKHLTHFFQEIQLYKLVVKSYQIHYGAPGEGLILLISYGYINYSDLMAIKNQQKWPY